MPTPPLGSTFVIVLARLCIGVMGSGIAYPLLSPVTLTVA